MTVVYRFRAYWCFMSHFIKALKKVSNSIHIVSLDLKFGITFALFFTDLIEKRVSEGIKDILWQHYYLADLGM